MRTPNFTAGPWKARGISILCERYMVASVNKIDDHYKANAALIAAAPDMYAALELALKYLVKAEIDGELAGTAVPVSRVNEIIYNVLEAARGES